MPNQTMGETANTDLSIANNSPCPGKKALEQSEPQISNSARRYSATSSNGAATAKSAEATAKSQDKPMKKPPNAELKTPAVQHNPSNKGKEVGGNPVIDLTYHAIQHGNIPAHNLYNYSLQYQEAYHLNAWHFCWRQGLQALDEYKKIHGNIDVPPNYTHPVVGSLFGWLANQRALYHQKDLSLNCFEQLLNLGVDFHQPTSSNIPFPMAAATNNYQIITTEEKLGSKGGRDRDKEKRRLSCTLCKDENRAHMCERGICAYFDADGNPKKRELFDEDINECDSRLGDVGVDTILPNSEKSVPPIARHDLVSVSTATNNQSISTVNAAHAKPTSQRQEGRSRVEKNRMHSSELCKEKNVELPNDRVEKESSKTKKRSLAGDKMNENTRQPFVIDVDLDPQPPLNPSSTVNHTTSAPGDPENPATKKYKKEIEL